MKGILGKKIGMTQVFTKEEQISLFDESLEEDKEDNIQKTIDDINNKFGKSIIKPASLELISKSRSKKQFLE